MSGAASTRRRRGLVGLIVAGVVVASLAGCEYGEATGVSDVTDISATLHGTVHSTDPLPEYWFEYDDAPHVVEVGEAWSEGRLTAASQEGGRFRAAANPRGMQGYAAGR